MATVHSSGHASGDSSSSSSSTSQTSSNPPSHPNPLGTTQGGPQPPASLPPTNTSISFSGLTGVIGDNAPTSNTTGGPSAPSTTTTATTAGGPTMNSALPSNTGIQSTGTTSAATPSGIPPPPTTQPAPGAMNSNSLTFSLGPNHAPLTQQQLAFQYQHFLQQQQAMTGRYPRFPQHLLPQQFQSMGSASYPTHQTTFQPFSTQAGQQPSAIQAQVATPSQAPTAQPPTTASGAAQPPITQASTGPSGQSQQPQQSSQGTQSKPIPVSFPSLSNAAATSLDSQSQPPASNTTSSATNTPSQSAFHGYPAVPPGLLPTPTRHAAPQPQQQPSQQNNLADLNSRLQRLQQPTTTQIGVARSSTHAGFPMPAPKRVHFSNPLSVIAPMGTSSTAHHPQFLSAVTHASAQPVTPTQHQPPIVQQLLTPPTAPPPTVTPVAPQIQQFTATAQAAIPSVSVPQHGSFLQYLPTSVDAAQLQYQQQYQFSHQNQVAAHAAARASAVSSSESKQDPSSPQGTRQKIHNRSPFLFEDLMRDASAGFHLYRGNILDKILKNKDWDSYDWGQIDPRPLITLAFYRGLEWHFEILQQALAVGDIAKVVLLAREHQDLQRLGRQVAGFLETRTPESIIKFLSASFEAAWDPTQPERFNRMPSSISSMLVQPIARGTGAQGTIVPLVAATSATILRPANQSIARKRAPAPHRSSWSSQPASSSYTSNRSSNTTRQKRHSNKYDACYTYNDNLCPYQVSLGTRCARGFVHVCSQCGKHHTATSEENCRKKLKRSP